MPWAPRPKVGRSVSRASTPPGPWCWPSSTRPAAGSSGSRRGILVAGYPTSDPGDHRAGWPRMSHHQLINTVGTRTDAVRALLVSGGNGDDLVPPSPGAVGADQPID